MSFRERLALAYNERAQEIVDRLLEAGVDDWRAIVAGLDQAFGKPPQTVTGEIEQTVQIVVQSAFEEEPLASSDSGTLSSDPEAT